MSRDSDRGKQGFACATAATQNLCQRLSDTKYEHTLSTLGIGEVQNFKYWMFNIPGRVATPGHIPEPRIHGHSVIQTGGGSRWLLSQSGLNRCKRSIFLLATCAGRDPSPSFVPLDVEVQLGNTPNSLGRIPRPFFKNTRNLWGS